MKTALINIVSDVPEIQWLQLFLKTNSINRYVFSFEPVTADAHIIYHLKREVYIPNSKERVAYVISEPPEIDIVSKSFLGQFGRVFSARFDYLVNLKSVKFCDGLLPWQAGFDFSEERPRVIQTADEIMRKWNMPRDIVLSVITSNKKMTSDQRLRLKFIEYLKNNIEGMEVFGRGVRDVQDKSTILLRSKYHLAIENSRHPGYWTEKFTDPLLCGTQIIYSGAPNLSDKFMSTVEIDLDNFEKSLETIKKTIQSNSWIQNVNQRCDDLQKFLSSENLFVLLDQWAKTLSESSFNEFLRIAPESKYFWHWYFKLRKLPIRIWCKFQNSRRSKLYS